jgi:hypothetical protein
MRGTRALLTLVVAFGGVSLADCAYVIALSVLARSGAAPSACPRSVPLRGGRQRGRPRLLGRHGAATLTAAVAVLRPGVIGTSALLAAAGWPLALLRFLLRSTGWCPPSTGPRRPR